MANKRITIAMSEEAASKMVQPIRDHISALKRKASNIIKAEYLKIGKNKYLEEVSANYPEYITRARYARLTYATLCLDWKMNEDIMLICPTWESRAIVPCTKEAIEQVDKISIEITEAQRDLERSCRTIGNTILKCSNMKKLKESYPEAYEILEKYDTESPKVKTELQLPLESINKILRKYEKSN